METKMKIWDDIKKFDSTDTNVSKFVFTKEDAVAESVLYRYPTYEERTVICCSTMSGCPMGCSFCGAGDNFARSLTAEEIYSQPMHLLECTGVDPDKIKKLQIMFMSMGEPLLNLNRLETALHVLYAKYPTAALLISTSAPIADYAKLRDISKRIPTVGLQFSVHETTDGARNALIPFTGKLTLVEISVQGDVWYEATGRHPYFNYCVHEKNNSDEDVERLKKLFDPKIWEATISVICERDETIAAANERQMELTTAFFNKMLAVGYSSRIFNPAGQDDIGGGCGQLWYVQEWMKNNPDKIKESIGGKTRATG